MVLLSLGGEIDVSLWLGCGEVARPAKFTGGTVAAMFLVETEVWFAGLPSLDSSLLADCLLST